MLRPRRFLVQGRIQPRSGCAFDGPIRTCPCEASHEGPEQDSPRRKEMLTGALIGVTVALIFMGIQKLKGKK
jgi:hypothetical protein